jgi:hypothetical protein
MRSRECLADSLLSSKTSFHNPAMAEVGVRLMEPMRIFGA